MPNRLMHEKSPYLLQHAGDPVDWYPWGMELSRKQGRKINPSSRPSGIQSAAGSMEWRTIILKKRKLPGF